MLPVRLRSGLVRQIGTIMARNEWHTCGGDITVRNETDGRSTITVRNETDGRSTITVRNKGGWQLYDYGAERGRDYDLSRGKLKVV